MHFSASSSSSLKKVLFFSFVLASIAACSPVEDSPSTQSSTAQPPTNPAQLNTAASAHPGAVIYEKHCAACHGEDKAQQSGAPSYNTLTRMRYQMIHYALTKGKMQLQASALSSSEKIAVVEYLVGMEPVDDSWIPAMMCPPERRKVDLSQPASITTFGFNQQNHRYLSSEQAGLDKHDLRQLELSWAIGFPGSTSMRAQPAVVGSMLFLPVADASRLFAINIDGAPCFSWVYENDISLRTSAAYGQLADGRHVLAFADLGSNVHLVDASNGALIWKKNVALFEYSLTTGTPVIFDGKVFVPISQYEISMGANDDHVCCKTHGAVTALDASNGETLWTAHTMPHAEPIRDRGDGQMIWGPSGAPIWNSPAIDAKRNLLYVGTGEATSEPAHPNTDAILAIDLDNGSIRWSFQATANDIFLSGCGRANSGLNCPRIPAADSRDVDFGASVILAQDSNGKDLILAGQKSGTLWALDPDAEGAVVWRQDFGEGSPLGGIHWGIAFDGEKVYAPINRPYRRLNPDGDQQPGIHGVDVDDGKVEWTFAAEGDCSGDRKTRVANCSSLIGLSGAPLVVDGAVIAGSLDGLLRIFDSQNGELLFQFDAAKSLTTINGVEATGGSFDAAQIVAAQGQLIVGSGYGRFGQMPGNVLLGFKPAQEAR